MKCTGSQVVVDNHLTDEIVPACHNICKCKFSNILPGFQKLLSPDTWFRVEKVVEILPPDNPFLLLLLELCAVYANRPGHIPLEVGQLDEGHLQDLGVHRAFNLQEVHKLLQISNLYSRIAWANKKVNDMTILRP